MRNDAVAVSSALYLVSGDVVISTPDRVNSRDSIWLSRSAAALRASSVFASSSPRCHRRSFSAFSTASLASRVL